MTIKTSSVLRLLILASTCVILACGSGPSGATSYLGLYSPGSSSTIGLAGPYTLGSMCERTSGNAPLGVMFSAVGSSSTLWTSPTSAIAGFHFITYKWDFGDPGSGTWSYGAPTAAGGTSGGTGNSRNIAWGPVAAHVYDSAGSYTVTITAYDGTNTLSQTACTVTVNAWPSDTTTVCVANGAAPVAGVDGCPTGAAVHGSVTTTSGATAFLADNTRVLLKHDDTFTGNLNVSCSHCEVNMYGSGAKPIVSSGRVNIFPPTLSTIIDDPRVVNVVATGGDGVGAALNIYLGCASTCSTDVGGVTHDLVYKSVIENNTNAVNGVEHDNFATVTPSGMMLVDNTFQNIGSSGEIMFIDGQDSAIMGNNIIGNGSSSQHVLRIQWWNRFTVNNNTLSNFPASKENIGLRGVNLPNTQQHWLPSTTLSSWGEVSDNNIISNAGAYGINIAPNDELAGTVEIMQNAIVERNYLHTTSGSGQTNCGRAEGEYITFRDEICDLSQSNYTFPTFWYADYNSSNGGQTPSSHIWIYNNTGITTANPTANPSCTPNVGTVCSITTVKNNSGATTIVPVNNLFYFPNWGGGNTVSGITGSQTTPNESNNTCMTGATHSCAGTVTTNPSFVNGSGTLGIPSDFKPNTGSYAIGAGTVVPVWYDALGFSQPSPRDMSAVNH